VISSNFHRSSDVIAEPAMTAATSGSSERIILQAANTATHSTAAAWTNTVERLLVEFTDLECPVALGVDSERSLTSAFLGLCRSQSRRTGRPITNPCALLARIKFEEISLFALEADRTFQLEPPHSVVALLACVYFTTLAVSIPLAVARAAHSD
jgi:hypothetical protein